jgi:hypothetical protein
MKKRHQHTLDAGGFNFIETLRKSHDVGYFPGADNAMLRNSRTKLRLLR